MAKKKNKEESLVPKDEKTLKMEGVQNLYNFLFEACNILRGPVSQDNFKDYITPILYFKRISDVYDEETQTALEESGGDEEYASLPEQHRFVIPDQMVVIGVIFANAPRILVLQLLVRCEV